jgi:hypothetical protein
VNHIICPCTSCLPNIFKVAGVSSICTRKLVMIRSANLFWLFSEGMSVSTPAGMAKNQ